MQGQICKGKDRGFKKEVRGYWLDIVVGPYAAIGVDCDKVTTNPPRPPYNVQYEGTCITFEDIVKPHLRSATQCSL
jgi:hypothetical protein